MTDLFQLFLEPAWRPFSIAGAVVVLIALLELGGLVLGIGLFEFLDDLLPDADTGGFLSWLGFGEAPFLVVLVVLLALFSIIGIAVQSAALGLSSSTLPAFIATAIAFIAALPATSWSAGRLARIIPSVESTGVTRDDFLGCTGEIVQGRATGERAAEARVEDYHGHSHWIQVRSESGDVLGPGEPIRIVRKASDIVFLARRRDVGIGDEATT